MVGLIRGQPDLRDHQLSEMLFRDSGCFHFLKEMQRDARTAGRFHMHREELTFMGLVRNFLRILQLKRAREPLENSLSGHCREKIANNQISKF